MKDRILFLLMLSFTCFQAQSQTTSGYSQEILAQLGIDQNIVEQVQNDSLPEGYNSITLYLNGNKIGLYELEFVKDNDFYIDKSFLERFDLKEDFLEKDKDLFKEVYPEGSVVYENASINLYLPYSYFNEDEKPAQIGKGGFLNYRFDYDKELTNDDEETASDVFSTELTYGLNMDGLLYRGAGNYNTVANEMNFSYNFFQKNFLSRETLGRIGDVFTLNPYHNNVDVLGIQYGSDNFFLSSSTITVEGIVSVQTRVEVYTSGDILIYRATVPSGYYEFDDITLPFSTNTVRVVERGVDGSFNEREEAVRQTAFNLQDDAEFGFTLGFANKKTFDLSEEDDPITGESLYYEEWVFSGYSELYKTFDQRLTGSFLFGDKYYFGGAGYTQNFQKNIFGLSSVNIEAGGNYDEEESNVGYYSSGSLNFNLNPNFGVNFFSRYESEDYRQLENLSSDFKYQMTTSIYTRVPYFDSLSLSYHQNNYYTEDMDEGVNISLQKYFENESYINIESYYDSDDEWSVSVYLSIPINFTNKISSFDIGYTQDRRTEQVDLNMNGDIAGYNYNTSYNYYINDDSSSMSVSANKYYEDVYASAGLYASGEGLDNAYASVEGGFGFSTDGYYDFIPEDVDDTFAFVEIDDYDGIKIRTVGADVSTDDGIALVPSLRPYKENSIEIVTKTLPENVTIDNGYQELYLSYGSIGKIKINTKPFYQSLIKLVNEDNEPITMDHVVLNGDDNFITTVGLDGLVFFEIETNDKIFKSKSKLNECWFDITTAIPDKENPNIKVVICK